MYSSDGVQSTADRSSERKTAYFHRLRETGYNESQSREIIEKNDESVLSKSFGSYDVEVRKRASTGVAPIEYAASYLGRIIKNNKGHAPSVDSKEVLAQREKFLLGDQIHERLSSEYGADQVRRNVQDSHYYTENDKFGAPVERVAHDIAAIRSVTSLLTKSPQLASQNSNVIITTLEPLIGKGREQFVRHVKFVSSQKAVSNFLNYFKDAIEKGYKGFPGDVKPNQSENIRVLHAGVMSCKEGIPLLESSNKATEQLNMKPERTPFESLQVPEPVNASDASHDQSGNAIGRTYRGANQDDLLNALLAEVRKLSIEVTEMKGKNQEKTVPWVQNPFSVGSSSVETYRRVRRYTGAKRPSDTSLSDLTGKGSQEKSEEKDQGPKSRTPSPQGR